MSDIDSDKWLEAMKSEMDSMGSNQVWTLVDPPKGARPVGCKWVYKCKLGDNRKSVVSKGPSTALSKLPEAGKHVLTKLYGVIISSRTTMILVYIRRSVGARLAYLVLYIDDILLIGNDVKMLGDIKAWLSTHFSMNDMGEASYILCIKIYRDRSRRMLGLTQSSYIEKVLKRFKMEHSKRGLLPMRHGIKLCKKQSPKIGEELKRMSNIPYASVVGSIQYAVQCTRPDVAYALSVTRRYQACAREAYWAAVKSILKYLKRTKDMFLIYGGGELKLEGYSTLASSRTMMMPKPNRILYSSLMVVW
ncbi:UNVERIFIED_CONTAM: Retrovirus-related Pol polyprotein from transposon TNT 1-94 [Sesamum radiatum]|uniref:Retrovirus-related Pol polyprotein from transposon TNT 1-94 n=1 Tax=Sesamum radiatum TaxID=300843 RepID=A0AAW2Q1S5_SESRA